MVPRAVRLAEFSRQEAGPRCQVSLAGRGDPANRRLSPSEPHVQPTSARVLRRRRCADFGSCRICVRPAPPRQFRLLAAIRFMPLRGSLRHVGRRGSMSVPRFPRTLEVPGWRRTRGGGAPASSDALGSGLRGPSFLKVCSERATSTLHPLVASVPDVCPARRCCALLQSGAPPVSAIRSSIVSAFSGP